MSSDTMRRTATRAHCHDSSRHRSPSVTALLAAFVFTLLVPATAYAGGFNTPGNLLIADELNNRVIELNDSGRIVWHFGTGAPLPGARTIVAPQAAKRYWYGGRTLIVCAGVPAGTPGYPAEGVIDNRVLLVNRYGKILWQYGKAGVAGAGPGQLDHPVDATWAPNDHILIVDQGNQRVIEVTMKKRIVWQYGTTGAAGAGANQLHDPAGVAWLYNGRILIADAGNDRVVEVTRAKRVYWQYGEPGVLSILDGPSSAYLLPSGRYLITDSGNSRAVEVTRTKNVTWTYATSARVGSVARPLPVQACRLRNGNTVISDGLNQQVIEVARDGMMLWSYGTLGVPGIQWGQLNGPRRVGVVPKISVSSSPLRPHGSG